MKVKLSNADRCAIDMVLENRAGGETPLDQCFQKSGGTALRGSVRSVETLLGMLAQMPATEPSAKLVAGTMRHIKRHAATYPVTHAPSPRPAVTSQASSHRTLH